VRRAVTAVVVLALVAGVTLVAVWVRDRYLDPAGGEAPATAGPGPATSTSTGPAKPKPKPTDTGMPKPTGKPVAGVPKRPENAQRMTVTYVYDGDTLQLQAAKPGAYVTTRAKIKVRLIGVDAPEMTPKKQCFAQQATDRLGTLAPKGATVWVAPDQDSWDDYRRRLFNVWTDQGVLIDHELVVQGYGRALRIWPNVTYWPVMERAQATAQKKKRGLWKAC
jgi:endonuclease YncB( thermonuclease family)